jgi:MFS family permease
VFAALASDLATSLTLMGLAIFYFIGAINIPAVAIQHAAPSHLRAQLAALYFLGVNVGGLGIGPLLTAWIASAFGGEHGIAPAFAVLGLICGPTALLAVLSVPRATRVST